MAHHDALETPDGQIFLVTKLREGQHAIVLQLPADVSDSTLKTEPHDLALA